jgi:lysophospholipase L1-like esterase
MPGVCSDGDRTARPRLRALFVALLASGTLAGPARAASCRTWDVNGDGKIQLAILGDSNSFAAVQDTWSVKLARALRDAQPGRWDVHQYARLGARITDDPKIERLGGAYQVDQALAAKMPVEVALLAFGTNDYLHGVTPEAVIEAYGMAIMRFEAVGAYVLLATTPPCWTSKCDRAKIDEMNALMRGVWPHRTMVDFSSWVTRDDLGEDGLHFLPAGHTKRSDAALKVLLGCRPSD